MTSTTTVPNDTFTQLTDLRTADEIFSYFQTVRGDIINHLNSDADFLVKHLYWGQQLLDVDYSCLMNCGWGNVWSHHVCRCCKLLGRILDLKAKKSSLLVLSGTHEGCRHTATRETLGELFFEARPELDQELGSQREEEDLQYYQADSVTLNLVVTWLIERLMTNVGLPHYQIIHHAAICHRHLVTVRNCSQLENVMEITESQCSIDLARNWIMQLVVILSTLADFNFLHGGRGLGCSQEAHCYHCLGLQVEGKYTLFLKGFESSTVTVKKTRLLPDHR